MLSMLQGSVEGGNNINPMLDLGFNHVLSELAGPYCHKVSGGQNLG